MKKHILIVSQLFYPEQFRINDIAKEWVRRGYKVTVVTGIPNYPQGKFYKGYGWFKRRKENWEGIDVIRIPLIARGKRSIGIIFNYFSFIVSGFFWKTFTKVKADLVFTFGVSPMTQALVGVWYAKRRKIPHYLYVQDLWPENVQVVAGINSPIVIKPISRMVNRIYKRCDKIFATSPSFVEEIQKRIFDGDDKNKAIYLPQYAEELYFKSEEKSSLIPQDGALNVTFTGNIGMAQGLEILTQAAVILKSKDMKVRFNIVGDGRNRENFCNGIKKLNVEEYFNMLGWKAPEEIPSILSASDAAFISFANDPLYSMTIPAKLQSYMACGTPILASACGETKRIIEESECGFVSSLGSAEELVDNIISFVNTSLSQRNLMSENAIAYSKKHFDKENIHNKLLSEMFALEEELASV